MWVEALEATRCEWRAAYEGQPSAFSGVAGLLAHAIGVGAALDMEWSEKTLIAA